MPADFHCRVELLFNPITTKIFSESLTALVFFSYKFLPKFQMFEMFEMLSVQGHTSWKTRNHQDRFWGKFRVVQHIYQIPAIREFIDKLRGCIRGEAMRNEL